MDSKFTKTEVLNTMTPGDSTACMIGYVERVESNPNSPKSKYYKIILCNNDGRKVQVVAWQANIAKLSVIESPGTVVQIKNATVIVPKQPKFNFGNVSYELQVRSHTTVKNLGIFEPATTEEDVEEVIMSAVSKHIGSKILVKGHIKSVFGQYITNTCNYYVGSLADVGDNVKVELTTQFDSTGLAEKGQYISIIGTVESRVPEGSPTIIRIDDQDHIKRDTTMPDANFADLLLYFTSV